MTDRKFYKTIYVVEVLSEGEHNSKSLRHIHYDITDGECSGEFERKSSTQLTRQEFVKACEDQGSDPAFFNLDYDGNDLYEEEEE